MQVQSHTGLGDFHYRTDKWWEDNQREVIDENSNPEIQSAGESAEADDEDEWKGNLNSANESLADRQLVNPAPVICDDAAKLYFAYLMVNRCPNIKTTTQVGKDRKPKRKVERYNNGEVKCTRNRSIKSAQGHWILEMVLGPFTKDVAMTVRAEWKNKCRGIPSRRDRGIELAAQYGVSCWDAEIDRQEEAARNATRDGSCSAGGSSSSNVSEPVPEPNSDVNTATTAGAVPTRGRGTKRGKRGTTRPPRGSTPSSRGQRGKQKRGRGRGRLASRQPIRENVQAEDIDMPVAGDDATEPPDQAADADDDREDPQPLQPDETEQAGQCFVCVGCSPTGKPEADGNSF